jgi:hypothetical protein
MSKPTKPCCLLVILRCPASRPHNFAPLVDPIRRALTFLYACGKESFSTKTSSSKSELVWLKSLLLGLPAVWELCASDVLLMPVPSAPKLTDVPPGENISWYRQLESREVIYVSMVAMELQHSSVPWLKWPVTSTNIFTWTGLECMQRITDKFTMYKKNNHHKISYKTKRNLPYTIIKYSHSYHTHIQCPKMYPHYKDDILIRPLHHI